MKKASQSSDNAPIYQLKIVLRHSRPPIWRRVTVRGNTPLDRLHDIIQVAMGWMNGHMHQFSTGAGFARRTFYGRPDPGFGGLDDRILDERKHTVSDLAPAAKRKFVYEYDFGDSWEHEVTAEKILPPGTSFKHPVCLGGARACPPEDCGGIYGYYNLLEVLSDPKHPEYEEMKEWVCGDWNAELFDVEAVNARLRHFKA